MDFNSGTEATPTMHMTYGSFSKGPLYNHERVDLKTERGRDRYKSKACGFPRRNRDADRAHLFNFASEDPSAY
jgi:hypothetical protein